ncbi:MAG: hypothetical protein ACI4LZ_03635, partial [Anaerovoracaceae bacterium]
MRDGCTLLVWPGDWHCKFLLEHFRALQVVAGIFSGRLCKIFLRVPQNVEWCSVKISDTDFVEFPSI